MAKQLIAMEKRVAGLTEELKKARAQPMAQDAVGADAMEVEVVSESKRRAAELDGLIQSLAAVRPATPEIDAVLQEYKSERAALRGTIFQAKPDNIKIRELGQRISKCESQLQRWQATQDEKRKKIAELQQELEDSEKHMQTTRTTLSELQAERTRLIGAAAVCAPPAEPPATGDAADERWSLSKMAQVMHQMGLATGLREKVQGVVQELQAEEAKIQEDKRLKAEQEQQERAAQQSAEDAAAAQAAQQRAAAAKDAEEAINAASIDELREYLKKCGMEVLAGGSDDDAELRAAVKRMHTAPSWQEAKRLRAK